jgi:hypothetical protein
MRRRKFIALLASATFCPIAGRTQQSDRVRRVGMLLDTAEDNAEGQARVVAFRQELKDLGWAEGGNLHIRRCSGIPFTRLANFLPRRSYRLLLLQCDNFGI